MTTYEDLSYLSDSFIHLTNDRTDLSSLNNDKENTYKLELLSKKLDGMNNKSINDKISLHSTPLVGRKVLQVLNENISQETYELTESMHSNDTLEQDSMIGLRKKDGERERPVLGDDNATFNSIGAGLEPRDSRNAKYDQFIDNMTQNQLYGDNEQYNQSNGRNNQSGQFNGLGKDQTDLHSKQFNQSIPNNSKNQIHSNPHSKHYYNQANLNSNSKAKEHLQSCNLQGSSKNLNIKIIKLIKQLNPLLSQKILNNLFQSIESLLVEGLDDIVLEQTMTLTTPPNSNLDNLPQTIKPSNPTLSNLNEFEKSPSPNPRMRYEIPKTPISFEPPSVQESIPSTADTKIPSIPNSQDNSSIEQLKQQISQLTKQNTNLKLENFDLNVKINHLNHQILSGDDDFKLDDKNQNNLQETIKLKSEIKQLESKLFRINQGYQELKNEFIWSKNQNNQRSKVEENEDKNDNNQPEVKQHNSSQPVKQSDNHQDGSLLNKQVIDAISQSYQSQLKSKDDEIEELSKILRHEIGDKSQILNENKIPSKFNRKYHELQLHILDSKSKVELINIIKQIMLTLLITNVDDLSINMNKYGNYLKLSIQFLDKLHDIMYNDKNTIKPSYYIRNQTGFDQDLSQLRECLSGMIDEVGKKVRK